MVGREMAAMNLRGAAGFDLDFDIRIEVATLCALSDLDGANIIVTVKNNPTDPDSAALVSLSSAGGDIVPTRPTSDAPGEIVYIPVKIRAAKTATMIPEKTYHWGAKIILENGDVPLLPECMRGCLTVGPGITDKISLT